MVGGARRRVVVTAGSSTPAAARRGRRRGPNKAIIYAFVGIVLLIPGGSLAFYVAENGANDQVRTIASAFRWTFLTLLEDQAPFDAKTVAGTVMTYVMLLGGLIFIAIATASLASKLVETLLRPDVKRARRRMQNHIVICGWSSKGDDIVRELRLQHVNRDIVVLAPLESAPTTTERVTFVKGHPSREEDLLRAGLDRADTAIVLADDTDPAIGPDDVDARTLLITLAVETLHPDVYSCVEVLRAENRRHFARANADELIISDEMTGALIANSAVIHGLSQVVGDLMTHSFGTEFRELAAPPTIVGMTFVDALAEVKRLTDSVLFAVASGDEPYAVNPSPDRTITAHDRLLTIAQGAGSSSA